MHDFVAHCLAKDADARVSATELLKHPFLKGARDERYLAQHLLGMGGASLKTARSFLLGAPSGSTSHVRAAAYPCLIKKLTGCCPCTAPLKRGMQRKLIH